MTTSSIRVLVRIARRDIARHRARSILVVALVALPVAAMVAGIAIYRTTTPTPERNDIAQFGRADLLAYNTTRAELGSYLPAGSVVEPVLSSDGRIVIPGARFDVSIRALDIEGLAAGMLTLVDGRAPSGSDEVAITKVVADVAEVVIGGQLVLDDGLSPTVVGMVENPMYLLDRVVVFDPPTALIDDESATWLIGLPVGTDPEAVVAASTDPVTGEQAVLIQSRESGRIQQIGDDSTSGYILILGALALVEASLIASAAFAVSIRRRQRELGLLAATGATPRQVAGSVLAEGAILGIAACVVGVVVGVGGAFGLTPWLDGLTQHRNPPLVVDVGGIVGPTLVGFLAAIIASIVPARTVARVPVLLALSGRRPAEAPARRTLWFGIAGVGLAAAMTVIGATMRNAGSDLSLVLLVGGAVLGTLGFGACAPWLLERLEGLAVRLPLAGRIAFRDIARSRSRSSPIVTAILAGCAAAIALGAWQTSRDAENLDGWHPSLYPDQLVLAGPGAEAAGEKLLQEPGVLSSTTVTQLFPADPANVLVSYRFPGARDASGKEINLYERCGNCNPGVTAPFEISSVSAATPELLTIAHAEAAAEAIQQGRAVLLAYEPMTAPVLEILFYREASSIEPSEQLTLPVTVLRVGAAGGAVLPQALLPDATIRRLGLVPGSDAGYGTDPVVVRYDHPVVDSDLARARDVAAGFADTMAANFSAPERPGAEFRIVIISLVLLFAVSVTGIAIALGEAESRPEQRALLALGADPRLRRRIGAARAAVLALLAGILAVPAGLLPIWGIFVSRGSPLAIPTLEIAGAVVALPILAVMSTWLLSRPIPDWAAFRSMGTGQ